MAFGGIFNPNYTMLPNQQTPNPQMPQQRAFDPTQMGEGNSNPMALYSLYGLLGGNANGGFSNTTQGAPQVPTVGTNSNSTQTTHSGPYIPPGAPPSSGSYTQPGTPIPPAPGPVAGGTPVPKPGSTPPPPPAPPPIPDASSAQEAGQNWMNQYNSPEYAAWYNSLAPSTRAYAHAPGNAATGQYLYNTGASQYDAFGNNVPWVPNR